MEILGIDIGGSGIKGAPVDTTTGTLTTPRKRIPTPQPSHPAAVAATVAELARLFAWEGPIGITFPAIVRHGIVRTAANVDKSWIGVDGGTLFANATGCPVLLLNDADAAGIAEMRLGAGRGQRGVVMVLTFGTGIGSALFSEGILVPNTELGHLKMWCDLDAETKAAYRVVEVDKVSLKKWSKRVNEYLAYLEALFSPDLFIFGGGASKQFDEIAPNLKTQAPVLLAQMKNEAGIVGAAIAAGDLAQPREVLAEPTDEQGNGPGEPPS
ncbi:MAG: ROK family protein [Anaerolineae bacterium]